MARRPDDHLRRLEARWLSLVRSIPDFVSVVDRQGRLQFMNRVAPGYRLEDVVGRPATDFLPPRERRRFMRKLRFVLRTGRRVTFEIESTGPHGRRSFYRDRMGPLRHRGRVEGAILIAHDITAARLQADETARAREFLGRIISSSDAGILAIDRRYRYTLWNPGMERMSGLSAERVMGRVAFEVFPFLKRIGEDKAFAAALRGRATVTRERRYVVPESGKEGWFEGSYAPLRGRDGKVAGAVGLIYEVTARKRAENALRLLLEPSAAAGEAGDFDAAMGRCVEAICRITGWTAGQAWRLDESGKRLYCVEEVFHGGARERALHRASRRYRFARGQALPGAAWRSGRPVWFSERALSSRSPRAIVARRAGLRAGFAFPIRQHGRLLAVLEFFSRDPEKPDEQLIAAYERLAAHLGVVFERRQLEAQLIEISESEQRRIGHDLHDGVGQLLTGLSFLAKGLAAKLQHRGDALAADAARIGELAGKATLEARNLAAGLSMIGPGPGLSASLELLAADSQALFGRPCVFRAAGPVDGLPPAVASHLYRIAQEAVRNAARHARPRRILIELIGGIRSVRLSVSSDGRGLPKNWESRGLGVHIMRYRARAIGAELAWKPRPGGGTTLVCTLPR